MEDMDPQRRIDDLLEANNIEVARRREAEGKAQEMAQAVVALVAEKIAAAQVWQRHVDELNKALSGMVANSTKVADTLTARIAELEKNNETLRDLNATLERKFEDRPEKFERAPICRSRCQKTFGGSA